MLRTNLLSLNCEIVAEIADGLEVMEAVEKTQPDIVFLDINMPHKSGLDVLLDIKNRFADLFVVMVSAHNTVDNLQKAFERKANGFVVKPFTNPKIKEAVLNYKDSVQTKSA